MKKLLSMVVLMLAVVCIFTACNLLPGTPTDKEDVITVEDGYLVVNGVKTEHKVDADDVIDVIDGYLVVNGVKTEYKVDDGKDPELKEDVITVEDGYLVVNGVKTEYKVHTEPTLSVIDGYVAVNGVKTEYKVDTADVITVENGYLVVNGVKTEHKVHADPVISVIDGYVAVNGVKTQYSVVAYGCNHIWDAVTISPTCTKTGYDSMTCKLCDKNVTVNETAKLDHTYSTTYSFDDNNHWFKCTGCDAKKDIAAHTPDAYNNCTVCGTPLAATLGIIYDVSADGTYAEVIGYNGTDRKVKIASEYNGLPVTGIYDNAFSGSSITSVVIPDSVTTIGNLAFSSCNNLTNVSLGNGVKVIGNSAFASTKIVSFTFPDSVTNIGTGLFSDCYSLETVVFSKKMTTISSFTFEKCDALRNVVIPYGIEIIDTHAFGSSGINSITIPDSVIQIGDYAFYATNLTSITIPENVISIGSNAFQYCSKLTSVEMPDNIQYVGRGVFSYCSQITYEEYGNCKYIGNQNNPYLVLIRTTSTALSKYSIHDNTKVIAEGAFDGCARFSELVIPKSVKFIQGAFEGCNNLKDVYYLGSKEEWEDIQIAKSIPNYVLLYVAQIHFNYVPTP
jgi:hypothetical protein